METVGLTPGAIKKLDEKMPKMPAAAMTHIVSVLAVWRSACSRFEYCRFSQMTSEGSGARLTRMGSP
eukprot:scaffold9114_cov118-Isochrysis_galbana.AAC.14